MNAVGYRLLKRGAVHDAIAVFRLNVGAYPQAPNPHDSLGDAYVATRDVRAAVESYRGAVGLAEAANRPNLAGYGKGLEAAFKRLNSSR